MKMSQCLLCSKPFQYRSNKKYCSDKCRYEHWIAAEESPAPCIYCGIPATTIDHIPPKSVRPILTGIPHPWKFLEVNACYECNSLLGDRQPWDLADRKAAIKAKLRRRYARYLTIPHWSFADLEKLGPDMRRHTLQGLVLRDFTRRRLDW